MSVISFRLDDDKTKEFESKCDELNIARVAFLKLCVKKLCNEEIKTCESCGRSFLPKWLKEK